VVSKRTISIYARRIEPTANWAVGEAHRRVWSRVLSLTPPLSSFPNLSAPFTTARTPLAAPPHAVKQETKTKADKDSAARQMLGMKGAALETDKFKIRVQLTKPVTWVPLIWGEWWLFLD
jgi:hypothetical protein